MNIELIDHSDGGSTILKLENATTEFGGNMFNLTMVELIRKHGNSFKKISSESLGERGIALIYTHNISGVIKP